MMIKSFKEIINELKIAKLYTVAPADLPKGEDLKSMTAQYGKEEARKRFKAKWDSSGFRGPGFEDYVHLTRDPLFAHYTRSYLSDTAGKQMAIYDVRPSHKMEFGDQGGNVAMVKDRVPARYIRKRWNDKTSKWDKWNVTNESIEGAFLPTNSMGTPETMPAAELITPIERTPVPIENGGKKVIMTGKKKTTKQIKSFKETVIDEGRLAGLYNTIRYKESSPEQQRRLRRILPAIQERKSKKLYVGHRGEWHPIIAQNHNLFDYSYQDTTMENGKYRRGFLDPLKKRFISAHKIGLDAAELPMDKITRMRMYGEETALQARILPAIKIGDQLVVGKRGKTHYDIWSDNFPGKLWQQDRNEVRVGFHDPQTKQFLLPYEAGVDSEDLSTPDLMTKVGRMRKFATEGIDPVLQSRLVPAIKSGSKVFLGKRGMVHRDIAAKQGIKNHFWKRDNSYWTGYVDPLKKKFYQSVSMDEPDFLDLDSTDLMTRSQRMIRFGNEETNLHESSTAAFRSDAGILKNPTFAQIASQQKHSQTGDLRYVAHQGNYYTADAFEMSHQDIMDNMGIPFHDGAGIITRDMLNRIKTHPKGVKGWMYEETINENRHMKDWRMLLKNREHLVPAVKDSQGQIHTATSMLSSHWDIIHQHKMMGDVAHYGYWHKKDKKFIATDVETTDLMTPQERFRKYGSEEFKSFGEFINESATAQFRPEYTPIIHNPTVTQLERQHTFAAGGSAMDNPFGKHKELRYLADRKGKNVWTVDAAEMIHNQMARVAGIDMTGEDTPSGYKSWVHNYYLGDIKPHHIKQIKAHPKGLTGWIRDRHKGSLSPYPND